MFGLIGPDGAGKTTTHPDDLRTPAMPTPASIRVLGLDPVRQHPQVTTSRSDTSRSDSACTRTSASTRTSPSSPRSTACATTRPAARSAAGAHAADAVRQSPRGTAVGWHEAEARAGLHADPPAAADRARRADDRCRSGIAPGVLEAALGVPLPGHHHRDVHAVSRRGGALLARGAAAQRAAAGARCAGRAAREPAGRTVRGDRARPPARGRI